MRKIDHLVIHCSVSEFGDAKIIDKWHRDRGFKMIGYHYVILNGRRYPDFYQHPYNPHIDGLVENGRNIEDIGAHIKGKNRNSIGICLIGDRYFTSEQLKSLVSLINELRLVPGVSDAEINGHYEFDSNKTCPNIDMWLIKKLTA